MAFFSPCLYHSHYSASYEVPSSTLLERTGGFYKGPPGTLLERPRTLFERTGGLGFVGIVFISPCIWAMSIPQPLWRLLRSLLQRTSWDPFKEDGGPLQRTSWDPFREDGGLLQDPFERTGGLYKRPPGTLLGRTGGIYKRPPGTLLERTGGLFKDLLGLFSRGQGAFVGNVCVSPCIWAMSIPQSLHYRALYKGPPRSILDGMMVLVAYF